MATERGSRTLASLPRTVLRFTRTQAALIATKDDQVRSERAPDYMVTPHRFHTDRAVGRVGIFAGHTAPWPVKGIRALRQIKSDYRDASVPRRAHR